MATPLVGTLMLGNPMRESGVVERLTGVASGALANVATLFLGLAVGSTMQADAFLRIAARDGRQHGRPDRQRRRWRRAARAAGRAVRGSGR